MTGGDGAGATASATDGLADARAHVLAVASALRARGVEVLTSEILTCLDALRIVEPADPEDLRIIARCCLVRRRADVPVLDAVFDALYATASMRVSGADPRPAAPRPEHVTPRPSDGADGSTRRAPRNPMLTLGDGADDERDPPTGATRDAVGVRASAHERLRRRRFDQASAEELVAMRRLMAAIPLSAPRRRSARTVAVRRGPRLDLRRTVREALRTDGEVVHRAWRTRRRRPRPVVLVLDVSGSMAGYARALLQFAFAARRRLGRVEVFCFGTRLTRVTDDLTGPRVDRALAAAAARVVDWDGGTRIGDALDALDREHGRRGRLRGAVLLICSDGLDRGDPGMLRDAMARLARRAHRIVWVSPLAGDPRYEPVQRGMRAAAPFVDRLVAGHDLASLEKLAAVLRGLERTA